MASKKDIHVVPHGDDWATRTEGSKRVGHITGTQAQAIEIARDQAKREHVEVVIHRPDGRIRDSDSYGNESPVIDKKH